MTATGSGDTRPRGAGAPASAPRRDWGPVEPEDIELAVVVAAVEMAWPRPVVVAPAENEPTPWRWSGRWWGPSRNEVPASRRRPWA